MSRGRRARVRKLALVAPPVAGLSVNLASFSDLVAVSGIGPGLAQQIIAGRPWARLRDLAGLRGLSRARLDRMVADHGLGL